MGSFPLFCSGLCRGCGRASGLLACLRL